MSGLRGRCIDCGGPTGIGRHRGRRCWSCYQHELSRTLPDRFEARFWEKVDASGDCWEWQGSMLRGYGRINRPGPAGNNHLRAHRVAYELLVGPIPPGLTIDHRCLNKRCVNPDHLEVVTAGVNGLRGQNPAAVNRRKTVCRRGHPLDEANTYEYRGHRNCRACNALRMRAVRASQAVAA